MPAPSSERRSYTKANRKTTHSRCSPSPESSQHSQLCKGQRRHLWKSFGCKQGQITLLNQSVGGSWQNYILQSPYSLCIITLHLVIFFHPSNFDTQMPFRKQKDFFVGAVAVYFFFKLWTILIFSELKKKKKNLLCFVLSSLSTPLSSSSVFHTLARSLASSFWPHSSLMKNAFPRCAHKGITWDSLKALLVLPAYKKRSHLLHHLFLSAGH